MKKRIFSGIQPSGALHIGNYLGAIKNWLNLLDEYDCIFGIVDYHAITVEYEPSELRQRIFELAAGYMAAGLTPDKCTLFVQSAVPEHTELAWILGTVTPIGHLYRMTQFKDKSEQHKQNINAGLFCYPILQAADIVLYKAVGVPVGEDQAQHLELTREIVRKFNNQYGETFPEPETILSPAPRVMGLDAERKMSKSCDNYIALADSPEITYEKLRTAITDPARIRRKDPGNPNICNLFSYHKFFSAEEIIERINKECRTAEIGCIDCKKLVAEAINKELAPLREGLQELQKQPDLVWNALLEGALRCREIAANTMQEVREKLGIP